MSAFNDFMAQVFDDVVNGGSGELPPSPNQEGERDDDDQRVAYRCREGACPAAFLAVERSRTIEQQQARIEAFQLMHRRDREQMAWLETRIEELEEERDRPVPHCCCCLDHCTHERPTE
jgi:hypothetical protein